MTGSFGSPGRNPLSSSRKLRGSGTLQWPCGPYDPFKGAGRTRFARRSAASWSCPRVTVSPGSRTARRRSCLTRRCWRRGGSRRTSSKRRPLTSPRLDSGFDVGLQLNNEVRASEFDPGEVYINVCEGTVTPSISAIPAISSVCSPVLGDRVTTRGARGTGAASSGPRRLSPLEAHPNPTLTPKPIPAGQSFIKSSCHFVSYNACGLRSEIRDEVLSFWSEHNWQAIAIQEFTSDQSSLSQIKTNAGDRLILGSKFGGRRSLATLIRSEIEVLRVSETEYSLTVLTPHWAFTNVHLPHGWVGDAELLVALDAIDADIASARRFQSRQAAETAPGERRRSCRGGGHTRTRPDYVPLFVTGDFNIQFSAPAEPGVGPFIPPPTPHLSSQAEGAAGARESALLAWALRLGLADGASFLADPLPPPPTTSPTTPNSGSVDTLICSPPGATLSLPRLLSTRLLLAKTFRIMSSLGSMLTLSPGVIQRKTPTTTTTTTATLNLPLPLLPTPNLDSEESAEERSRVGASELRLRRQSMRQLSKSTLT